MLKVRGPSMNMASDENSSSSWDTNENVNKIKPRPKGSTVLLEKIKTGLFKH